MSYRYSQSSQSHEIKSSLPDLGTLPLHGLLSPSHAPAARPCSGRAAQAERSDFELLKAFKLPLGAGGGLVAAEVPDFAGLGRAPGRAVLAQEHVEEDADHRLAAALAGFQHARVDHQNLGAAGAGVRGGLARDLRVDLRGGELGDVIQVALVPGVLQAGVEGLGPGQELLLVHAPGHDHPAGLRGRAIVGAQIAPAAAVASGRPPGAAGLAVRAKAAGPGVLGLARLPPRAQEPEEQEQAAADEQDIEHARAGKAAAEEHGTDEPAHEQAAEHAAQAPETRGAGRGLLAGSGLALHVRGLLGRGRRPAVGGLAAEGLAAAQAGRVGLPGEGEEQGQKKGEYQRDEQETRETGPVRGRGNRKRCAGGMHGTSVMLLAGGPVNAKRELQHD